MAWDSKRPVPWRRLGMYLAIYAMAMAGFTALTGGKIASVLGGLVIGVPIAALFVIVLAKFGYLLPILRSREELAAERAARLERRRAARGAPAEPVGAVAADTVRARPAPTRRTSTGPSQHPRRTNRARKR